MVHPVRKTVSSKTTYSIDLKPGMDSDETISSSTPWWSLDAGVTDITLSNQQMNSGEAVITVAGGVLGRKYKVYVDADTSKGQHLHDALLIEIVPD